MTNENIFNTIFGAVMDELGLNGWWELFDSEYFELVETRIAEEFETEDVDEVEGFIEWYNEMAWDL